MSYRPITDVWILARPKVKYYGAYPGGFLERAKPLIGCGRKGAKVLHVCGGHASLYPYDKDFLGWGINDATMDIDPETKPTFVGNATVHGDWPIQDFDGIICDPPYTQEDAKQYRIPNFPEPNKILKFALRTVPVGGMVGMLHYIVPQPPTRKDPITGEVIQLAKFIACIGIFVGYNNRMRAFSVFQRRE